MSLCLRVAVRSVCDCKRRTLQPLCRTQSLGTSACSLKPVSVFNKNLEEMSRGIVAGLKTEEHPVVHKTFGETVAACENVQEHLRGFCNTVQLGFCNTVQLRSALGSNIHTATPPCRFRNCPASVCCELSLQCCRVSVSGLPAIALPTSTTTPTMVSWTPSSKCPRECQRAS